MRAFRFWFYCRPVHTARRPLVFRVLDLFSFRVFLFVCIVCRPFANGKRHGENGVLRRCARQLGEHGQAGRNHRISKTIRLKVFLDVVVILFVFCPAAKVNVEYTVNAQIYI